MWSLLVLFSNWNLPFLQNKNILSAVLTLIQELDQTSLLTLRKEIDQKLQDQDETDSDSQDRNVHAEEKEVIAD